MLRFVHCVKMLLSRKRADNLPPQVAKDGQEALDLVKESMRGDDHQAFSKLHLILTIYRASADPLVRSDFYGCSNAQCRWPSEYKIDPRDWLPGADRCINCVRRRKQHPRLPGFWNELLPEQAHSQTATEESAKGVLPANSRGE